MNEKKAKRIRKTLRAQGIAIGDVEYQQTQRGIWATVTLHYTCGRAKYQEAKRAES